MSTPATRRALPARSPGGDWRPALVEVDPDRRSIRRATPMPAGATATRNSTAAVRVQRSARSRCRMALTAGVVLRGAHLGRGQPSGRDAPAEVDGAAPLDVVATAEHAVHVRRPDVPAHVDIARPVTLTSPPVDDEASAGRAFGRPAMQRDAS